MSQKVAADASSGTWGTPIIITGADAIIGSIESDNGLAWLQAAGPGAWTPAGSTTTLTVTFYQGGASINTRTVIITRSGATLTAPEPDTVDGVTYSRINNSTSAITIEFEHVASGIKVSETIYAISGANGNDGSGLSADVPRLTGIEFIGNTGTGKVGWTAGILDYGGSQYNITAKDVGSGSTLQYIYWDADDTNTTFKVTSDIATCIAAGNWPMCFNDGGKAIPAAANKMIIGGLLKVSTLAAINADLGNITSGTIILNLGGNYRLKISASGIQGSDDAGSDWYNIIYQGASGVIVNADEIKVGSLLADRINSASLAGVNASGVTAYRERVSFGNAPNRDFYTDADSISFTLDAAAVDIDFEITLQSLSSGKVASSYMYIKNSGGTKVWQSSVYQHTYGDPQLIEELNGINVEDAGITVGQTYKIGIATKSSVMYSSTYSYLRAWFGRGKTFDVTK